MKSQVVAKILGYQDFDNYDEVGVYTKGYRVLNKIPRMPSSIVDNLVKSFKSFQHILAADIPQLDEVDGIGEARKKKLLNHFKSVKKMKEASLEELEAVIPKNTALKLYEVLHKE